MKRHGNKTLQPIGAIVPFSDPIVIDGDLALVGAFSQSPLPRRTLVSTTALKLFAAAHRFRP